MIPEYPNFINISINLKDTINNFTSKFAPYSDFNFVSLYCWNTDNSSQVSMLNENLVIKMPDYTSNEYNLSILGTNKIDETIMTLLNNEKNIKLVPHSVIGAIENKKHFIIHEDEGNNDYIYEVAKLATFDGKDFKNKRNLLNSFVKELGPDIKAIHSEIITFGEVHRLKEIVNTWNATGEGKDAEMESTAINRLFATFHFFDLFVTEVIVDQTVVAFSVNEVLGNGFAICHFEKAVLVHDGIYSYLNKAVANELLKRGCEYVNWEQDLDLPGLRKSKKSYKPSSMLKKYTVSKNKHSEVHHRRQTK